MTVWLSNVACLQRFDKIYAKLLRAGFSFFSEHDEQLTMKGGDTATPPGIHL